jgi:hypothetical protein
MRSNAQLMRFVDRQSTTIARLRARIVRRKDIIKELTTQQAYTRGDHSDNSPRDTTNSSCVLVEDAHDTSFLLQQNYSVGKENECSYYYHEEQPNLEPQLAKIKETQDNKKNRTMDVLRLRSLTICYHGDLSYPQPSSCNNAYLWVLLHWRWGHPYNMLRRDMSRINWKSRSLRVLSTIYSLLSALRNKA